MRKSMFAVSRRALRTLKEMVVPGLVLLLALVPAAVVNMAMPAPVSAAVQLRGNATTGATVGTNLTIDKPTGVVAGDVMIVNIAGVGSNNTIPTSDGWILIDGADLGSSPPRYGAVLYRVVDGTEDLSFTFALGLGTSGAVGSIVAFSGVDTSGVSPFDAVPGAILVPDYKTTGVEATSITTASANAAVIMLGMAANSDPTWSGWTTTSSGVMNELYDTQIGGSNQASVGAAWNTKTTAGNTGDGAATLSSAERNGGILIALKPAASTTLAVAEVTGTYGETVNLVATLSPAVAGKTISFTLNGIAAGTAATDSSGAASITGANLPGIGAGSYPTGVGASFAGDAGYWPCSGTASLTVKPRDVTVTADESGKVYGDADPALTYKLSAGSLVVGDAFSGKLARETGEDAGTYAICRGTLALSSNYYLTFVESTFAINVRNIVVKANDSGKVVGETDPAFAYQITSGSLVTGDAFSGELDREAGEDVGTYAIRRGTLALNDNYNFVFVSGVFTITNSDGGGPFAPTVDGISPQSGQPGDTLDVVINGTNLAGATSVDFGPGVTVNSFEVETSTRIVASITIDPAAGENENKIVVTTALGEGQLPNAFSIDLSAGEPRVQGLWLLIVLLLLAIASALILFAWLKRGSRPVAAPELVPVLAPSRPPGGTWGAAEPSEAATVRDEPLHEAAMAADLEQSAVATAAVNEPLVEAENRVEVEQAPAPIAASQPSEEVEQGSATAADQPAEATPEAVELEQPAAPATAADTPIEETEKPADLPQAAAAAAAAPAHAPRKRTTKRKTATPASSRPRTPAKKRKQARG